MTITLLLYNLKLNILIFPGPTSLYSSLIIFIRTYEMHWTDSVFVWTLSCHLRSGPWGQLRLYSGRGKEWKAIAPWKLLCVAKL